MAAITIFCKNESSRLKYVLDWVFRDVLHVLYSLTDDEEELKEYPFFIAYGTSFENALTIPDTGFLWEKGIKKQEIGTGQWKDIPTLFHTDSNSTTIPFDLFSAIFFLISRYEEYYDHKPDKHGRYPASESILCKYEWLLRPLVDEWVYELYLLLQEKGIPVQLTPFQYTPTYDIDMAYSYKHKGIKRNLGGFLRSFLKFDFKAINRRREILLHEKADPFDSFVFIKQLHREKNLKPIYFILAALKTTAFDKNISPEHEAMEKLIVRLNKEGQIALHPSYFSDNDDTFKAEKGILEQTIGEAITHSRQHYLRMSLPETYRRLLKLYVLHDYTMGYGTALGFRAGTARTFHWFDIENEAQTLLRVHPFCFMDTTARYQENLDVAESFQKLEQLKQVLQRAQSPLVTIFHNFSLGTDLQWKNWNEQYASFVSKL